MIIIDPVTRQRIVADKWNSNDIQYDLIGDSAISNEDEFIGRAVSGALTRQQQMWGGISNELQDTDAGVNGAKLPNLTERGKNKGTHITQQKDRRYNDGKFI